MLMSLSKIIISFILNDSCDEKQREICEYGCELWLYTILSTLGLLMIGLIAKAPIEAITIISIFYVCQSNGGGFMLLRTQNVSSRWHVALVSAF